MKNLREAFAERLEDLVTDPSMGVSDASFTLPERVRNGEKIPRWGNLLDAFAASCQDVGLYGPDFNREEARNLFFEDQDEDQNGDRHR